MAILPPEFQAIAAATDATLQALFPEITASHPKALILLRRALRQALLVGGKRLRPCLLVAVADMFEVDRKQSLRAAAAVEMVHAYSLVHDDLPAMDDSPLRRGQPTLHVTYDEATAILVGDALLTGAFETLASPQMKLASDVQLQLIQLLAKAAGEAGMVGGQMIDIQADRSLVSEEAIVNLQMMKTGAMIVASLEIGACLGRASPQQRQALNGFGSDIGLAFQIVDDLLDVFGNTSEIGKPAGQDERHEKSTFIDILGIEGAKKKVDRLVNSAIEKVDIFGPKAEVLSSLATYIRDRSL